MSNAGRTPRSPASARAERAGRRVGVEREQHGLVGARGVRTVDAGVRADEPVARLADEHAGAFADHARRPRRAPPGRPAGPCPGARRCPRARGPGSMSASFRTRPSAFDTTLWATTRTSPPARSGGARAGDQGREVVTRRHLRQRSERGCRERGQPARRCWIAGATGGATAGGRRGATVWRTFERSSWRSAPRVIGRAAALLQEHGELGEVVGSVDVEHQRGHGLDPVAQAGGVGAVEVALERVGAEARRDDASGGREQQRVRPGAVAVGDDRRRRSRRPRALASSALTSPGSSERRVAGHQQHAVEAARRWRGRCRSRRRRDWPSSPGSKSSTTPFAAGGRLRHRVRRHDGDRVDARHAPQRGEHVEEHRLRERLAVNPIRAVRTAAAWRRRSS